jgi:hypothetical protein
VMKFFAALPTLPGWHGGLRHRALLGT